MAIFALKSALKQAFNARFMFKSDKLGVVKCLTASLLPSMLCQAKRIDLDLITGKTYESIVKTYCIFVNESTQEKALGRQHTPLAPKVSKVSKSQISELCHLMALPCNGYKLNLLTSASMCHMALNWQNARNFRMLFCLFCSETCEAKN